MPPPTTRKPNYRQFRWVGSGQRATAIGCEFHKGQSTTFRDKNAAPATAKGFAEDIRDRRPTHVNLDHNGR